jgi:hypothetical protein
MQPGGAIRERHDRADLLFKDVVVGFLSKLGISVAFSGILTSIPNNIKTVIGGKRK